MNDEAKKQVLLLIRRASEADASDAMLYSQAAMNAANALAVIDGPSVVNQRSASEYSDK